LATPCLRQPGGATGGAPDTRAPGPFCHAGAAGGSGLFLAAIVSAFWYLRLEEWTASNEAVKRDVEYTQQRLRLRLLERQEQLMRIAREVPTARSTLDDFSSRA
jgi:hypothetical protein